MIQTSKRYKAKIKLKRCLYKEIHYKIEHKKYKIMHHTLYYSNILYLAITLVEFPSSRLVLWQCTGWTWLNTVPLLCGSMHCLHSVQCSKQINTRPFTSKPTSSVQTQNKSIYVPITQIQNPTYAKLNLLNISTLLLI